MALPKDVNARKYYRVARQRLEEAEILIRNNLWAAAIYLTGYAVECSLKALIITVTPLNQGGKVIVSLKDDFGHSLRRLRAGIIKLGINPPRPVVNALLFTSSWSPELRYEPGPGDPAEAGAFLAAAVLVTDWAYQRM